MIIGLFDFAAICVLRAVCLPIFPPERLILGGWLAAAWHSCTDWVCSTKHPLLGLVVITRPEGMDSAISVACLGILCISE
jgi:hypothetical protein